MQANCDNSAVVDIVNHQTAKDDLLCHLMRCLFFACAHFDVTIVAKHTPGICNGAADALSRNNLSLLCTGASPFVYSNLHSSGHPTGAVSQTPHLDITGVDSLVQQYYVDTLAPTTRRVYSTAQSRYLEFCRMYNFSPFPLTQESLLRFVAVLASQALAHKLVKVYLSAVRHLHITCCGSDPRLCNMMGLQYVLQGIKRSQAVKGLSSRPRLLITAAILRTLRCSWESQGPTIDRRMLWAAACTCFFGFLRSREATVPSRSAYDPAIHLSVSDITVDSHSTPTSIALRIKCSKTGPFRTGITIYLGRTDSDICPVAACSVTWQRGG